MEQRKLRRALMHNTIEEKELSEVATTIASIDSFSNSEDIKSTLEMKKQSKSDLDFKQSNLISQINKNLEN